MDDDTEQDVDIAAQMGFASFGGKPKHKKRKLEAMSANHQVTMPMIDRQTKTQPAKMESKVMAAAEPHPELRAYRHGVHNEQGDMVYFMPSFIEDPWKALRKDENAQ